MAALSGNFYEETQEWLKEVAPFLGECAAEEFYRRFAQDAREVYCCLGLHGGACADTRACWSKSWVDTSEFARHYVYDERPDTFTELIYEQFRRETSEYQCYRENWSRCFYRMTFWEKKHTGDGNWEPIPLKTVDVEFTCKPWEVIGITEVFDAL